MFSPSLGGFKCLDLQKVDSPEIKDVFDHLKDIPISISLLAMSLLSKISNRSSSPEKGLDLAILKALFLPMPGIASRVSMGILFISRGCGMAVTDLYP